MSPLIIIILCIIVAVMVYVYMTMQTRSMIDAEPLKKMHRIAGTTLELPGSGRYYYDGWFYVSANFPPNQRNVLFRRDNDLVVSLQGSKLQLWTNITGADKIVDASGVIPAATAAPTDASMVLDITPAFPYQKWVYLVINVDGITLDVYLEGKLVANKTMTGPIKVTLVDNSELVVGNKFTDGKVSMFNRVTQNINPQQVWAKYVANSAQNASPSTYHVNVDLMNNNAVKSSYNVY